MIESLSIEFIIGAIFGAGSFYGLTLFRLSHQEKKFDKFDRKLDSISYEIKHLSERIARIEGKLNGK